MPAPTDETEHPSKVTGAAAAGATLLLVDGHALRRAAFAKLLEDWAGKRGLAVAVATAASPSEALPPGGVRLALLGIGGMPADAPEVPRAIGDLARRLPDAAVVVLAERGGAAGVVAALRAGARGVVTAAMNPALVLGALGFILAGGSFFPPEALLASGAADGGDRRGEPPGHGGPPGGGAEEPRGEAEAGPSLTARQGEVLALLRQGLPNKLIARRLALCEATVKVHVRQVMRRLGAANRTQAALLPR